MQTLKNKAFHVSIQWNALVRRLLFLRKGHSHKSGVMFDKVTKAYYNFSALFCFMLLFMFLFCF